MRVAIVVLLSGMWTFQGLAQEADPAATVRSEKMQAGGDAHKTFFLMGPKTPKPPKDGYGLIMVLPGGDGSAEFETFVKRVYALAVPEDLLVQLVAMQWTPQQRIVWPTRTSRVPKQAFSTEEFIESVISKTAGKYPLDRRRIISLSWSSGGPAAYSASMSPGSSITGSFVAMSVFRASPQELRLAKGQVYYIYHSREDGTCPFMMAQRGAKVLAENGAATRLVEYAGGHGWRGNVYDDIHTGLAWIMEQTVKRALATQPASRPAAAKSKVR